jgi:histidinol dehydrogenase
MSPRDRDRLLVRSEEDLAPYIEKARPIIEAVRRDGDRALIRFALEFDRAKIRPDRIAAQPADFRRAIGRLPGSLLAAIEYALANIRAFHQAQMPESMWLKELRPGAFAGDRVRPIPSVACYVPRGKGSFPSVAMMTVVPAVIAGVKRIAILTPPGPDGEIDDATLAVAKFAGITEIYKCGGAQAVAAAAYGTRTVPRLAKIVGPGSPYLVAAKRLLSDLIDPGTPAGPSESIVLADGGADAALTALDLIVESEHGPDSSAFLVTDSAELARKAREAIPRHWRRMGRERRAYSSAVLCGARGGVVLARDMNQAVRFVNDYAPEHLMIHARDPFAYLGRIENAGEILLGEHTPLPLGNFVLGPNAVLPTSGQARTFSPLSVFDFLKRTSVGYVTRGAYPELARHGQILAAYEGFDGHANALAAQRSGAKRR